MSRCPQGANGRSNHEATLEETRSAAAAVVDRAKNSLKAAALDCIALDESGDFPADHKLGLFEVAPADDTRAMTPPEAAAMPRISEAQVEFSVQRQEAGHLDSPSARGVNVTVLLQLSLKGDRTKQGRRPAFAPPGMQDYEAIRMSSRSLKAASDAKAPIGVPDREKMGAAVAAAAVASTRDRAEVQAAISVLTWNILAGAEEAGASMVHLEVTAVFGSGGDCYTTNQDIDLTRNSCQESSHSSSLPSWSWATLASENDFDEQEATILVGNLEWLLEEDVRDKLDEIAVADVKVYRRTHTEAKGVEPSQAGRSESQLQEQQLLLQATLRKRDSSGVGVDSTSEKASARFRTSLTPYAEQRPQARRGAAPEIGSNDSGVPTAKGVSPNQAGGSVNAPPSQSCVVSEMEDGEWWRELDEHERGRGMAAVNALPRHPDWKPGQWREFQDRTRKQRRRKKIEKTARRRENNIKSETHDIIESRTKEKRRGNLGVIGFARRLWRAAGREWGRFRRLLRPK